MTIEEKPKLAIQTQQHGRISAWKKKSIKSALGLLLIIGAGWLPVQRLLQVSSVEAVVNARLVTLRAPIEGIVVFEESNTKVGSQVTRGSYLIRIDNPRVDPGNLNQLRRNLDQVRDEQTIVKGRLQFLNSQRPKLERQVNAFRQGRTKQIKAQSKSLKAEIAALRAQRNQSQSELERLTLLNRKGFAVDANIEKVESQALFAEEQMKALQARQEVLAVELKAVQDGSFIGDSYNDRPKSSQELDEVLSEINTLDANLHKWQARQQQLAQDLTLEQERFNRLSLARLSAPAHSQVWEIMTAAGEYVSRGQDLVRLLDCNSGIVTSTVSESVYNRLQIGMPARFRLREGSDDFSGTVVQLTGVAAASSNLAISPASLTEESYRVTVAIPDLASQNQCNIGRTGRVIFEPEI